jgi:DNA-binding LytR/AlgR family response regulator
MNNSIHVGGRTSVPVNEIQYLEAKENYSLIHLCTGNKILVATTLKTLEERLSSFQFTRVRRGILVSDNFIKKVVNNRVTLRNNLVLMIPRRKLDQFKYSGE